MNTPPVTQSELAAKIQEITDQAIADLKKLGEERHVIVKNYIKELEAKKIEAIRASLTNGQ